MRSPFSIRPKSRIASPAAASKPRSGLGSRRLWVISVAGEAGLVRWFVIVKTGGHGQMGSLGEKRDSSQAKCWLSRLFYL